MAFSFSVSNSKMLKGVNFKDDSVDWNSYSFKNKLRVLVVDDSPIERSIWLKVLEHLKVEGQEVENGKEALDLFLAGTNFDLILMDNHMPIMNGLEATRKLRLMGVHAKIVGVGVEATIEEKQEFMEAGTDDYDFRPISVAKLIQLLQEIDGNK